MSPNRYGIAVPKLQEFAAAQIGKGESGANNAGPYVAMLHRGARDEGNWCAALIAYLLEECRIIPILPDRHRRGAKGLTKYLAKHFGSWSVRPRWLRKPKHIRDPRPNDVVAWHRAAKGATLEEMHRDWRGHVGKALDYDPKTDTLTVLEGNVGRFPAKVKVRVYRNGRWRRKLYGIATIDALHPERPGNC